VASFQQIKAQIAKLEREAVAARKKDTAQVIAQIKQLMADYELTIEDLGLRKPRKAAAKASGQPKYRDPKTGATWTGKGRAPGWIAAAVKAGKQDKFLIEKQEGAKPAAKKNIRATTKKRTTPAVAKSTKQSRTKVAPPSSAAASKPTKPAVKRTPKKAAAKTPTQ